MRRFWLRWLAMLVLLLGLWQPHIIASADSPATPKSRYRSGEILVKPRDGAVIIQGLSALLADPSVRPLGTISSAGVMYLGVPAGEELSWVRRLSQSPYVEFAQLNYIYELWAEPDDPLYPQQWGLPTVKAPAAWDVTTGDPGIVVAVVDTGTDPSHPDLAGAIWTNPNPTKSPPDVNGWNTISNTNVITDDLSPSHGTHLSGIIAARLNNGTGIAGLAGTGTVMPVKVGGGTSEPTSFSIGQGIRYAVDHGARVINLSLATFDRDATVEAEVNNALAKNAVVVAAAGGCGVGCSSSTTPNPVTYPASQSGVLAVSNLGRNGNRYFTSEYGPYIAVAAPGQSITSTLYITSTGSHRYGALTGTSMATPHVSALAALILSVNPDLTNTEVARIITSTASLAPNRNDDLGYGVINAAAALQATPHKLRVQPPSGTLRQSVGAAAVTGQIVNPGTGPSTWQAESATPWLSVGPVTGTTPSYAVVTVDPSKLPGFTMQTGFITVTSRLTNTVASTQIVSVTARLVNSTVFLPMVVKGATSVAGW